MIEKENVAEEVLSAIPHRPPFLFVDRVLSSTETSVVAERTLKVDEFFFKGHYPQIPLMPGVLICEAIFQTAGIFMSQKLLKEGDIKGRVPVLTRIELAKFKRMAFPGDALTLEATFVQKLKDFYFFKGNAKKDGDVLVTIEFILGMVEAKSL